MLTHPLRESVSLVSFSVLPVVTQNCTHALPGASVPLLPFSTASMENVAVRSLSLHLKALRWLSHQAAAVLLDSALVSFADAAPSAISLAETHRCSPEAHW